MDPYLQWLEIPRHLRPGVQLPPHHYDLLAIEIFSSNWTLIRSQADRRMGLVKEHELGPHSADSQKLLRELAMARKVLLDPKRKAKYDRELSLALGLPEPDVADIASQEFDFETESLFPEEETPFEEMEPRLPPRRKRKKSNSPPKPVKSSIALSVLTNPASIRIGAVAVAAILLLGLIVWSATSLLPSRSVDDSSGNQLAENESSHVEKPADIRAPQKTTVAPAIVEGARPSASNAFASQPQRARPQQSVSRPIPPNGEGSPSSSTESGSPKLMASTMNAASVKEDATEEQVASAKQEPEPSSDPLPIFPPLQAPTKRLIPIPLEKIPISDRGIFEFSKSVSNEVDGSHGYAAYLAFSKSYIFTSEQQERIDSTLETWEQRAKLGQVRVGTRWISSSEAETLHQQSDALVDQAIQMMSLRQFDQAARLLETASQTDSTGIRAEYLLGLMYSLPYVGGPNAPDLAEAHFEKVIDRVPDHPEALNSLGICLIKQQQFPSAFNRFKRAAELLPNCDVVAHNLRRLQSLGESKVCNVPGTVIKNCELLVQELESSGAASPGNVSGSWLHLVPVFSERERELQRTAGPAGTRMAGLGFAIAPELLLTNRRPVFSESLGVADEVVAISLTDDANTEVSGKVVFLADEHDVAILHFPKLAAKPLAFSSVSVGVEETSSIFCSTSLVSSKVLAEDALVMALPDRSRQSVPESILFRASGQFSMCEGIATNASGEVISLISGGFADDQGMILHGVATPVVTQYLAPFSAQFAANVDDNGVASSGDIRGSTYRITSLYESGTSGLTSLGLGQSATVFNDRTCTTCSGKQRVGCLNTQCRQGKITERYSVIGYAGPPGNQRQISVPKTRQVTCNRCSGAGTRSCPACRNGVQ